MSKITTERIAGGWMASFEDERGGFMATDIGSRDRALFKLGIILGVRGEVQSEEQVNEIEMQSIGDPLGNLLSARLRRYLHRLERLKGNFQHASNTGDEETAKRSQKHLTKTAARILEIREIARLTGITLQEEAPDASRS